MKHASMASVVLLLGLSSLCMWAIGLGFGAFQGLGALHGLAVVATYPLILVLVEERPAQRDLARSFLIAFLLGGALTCGLLAAHLVIAWLLIWGISAFSTFASYAWLHRAILRDLVHAARTARR